MIPTAPPPPPDLCGPETGVVCRWVHEHTDGNRLAAGIADYLIGRPLAIAGVLGGAWVVRWLVRRLVARGVHRVLLRLPVEGAGAAGGTVASPAFEPLSLPAWAWDREDVRDALRHRDVGALFRCVQRYTGASQSRLAVTSGLLQGRVSEILKGSRTVAALEVFERIADGLAMPDMARMLLGLAPRHPVGHVDWASSG